MQHWQHYQSSCTYNRRVSTIGTVVIMPVLRTILQSEFKEDQLTRLSGLQISLFQASTCSSTSTSPSFLVCPTGRGWLQEESVFGIPGRPCKCFETNLPFPARSILTRCLPSPTAYDVFTSVSTRTQQSAVFHDGLEVESDPA
jgi:hypothetical protein